MALNPTASKDSHNWNYSRPADPGFSLSLEGTVVAIQEVQAMEFGAGGKPTVPKFWKDGGPVWNIRLVIAGAQGGYRTWTFPPAGKAAKAGEKPSVHIDLFKLAGGEDMFDLIGKTIHVETQAPPAGFSYGIGNPRPWAVSLVPEGTGPYQLAEPLDPMYLVPQLLANGAASGGQVAAPAYAGPSFNEVAAQAAQVPGAVMSPEQFALAQAQAAAAQAAAPMPPAVPAPATYDEDIPF